MIVLDYTESLPPMQGVSVRARNPKYFDQPERADFVCTNSPHILQVYKALGVPEWPGKITPEVTPKAVVQEVDMSIPEDWRKLTWFKQRAIAMRFTDEKNLTKSRVEEILEAEWAKQTSE